jgi:hypothetical protein
MRQGSDANTRLTWNLYDFVNSRKQCPLDKIGVVLVVLGSCRISLQHPRKVNILGRWLTVKTSSLLLYKAIISIIVKVAQP